MMRRLLRPFVALLAIGLVPGAALAVPFVYVANEDDTVSVIDAATNMVVATLPLPDGANPRNLSVSPDGTRVYVPNRDDNSVTVINGVMNTVITTINDDGFAEPFGSSVNPSGSRVYVTNKDGNSFTVIDASDNSIVTTVKHDCMSDPEWVVVHPSGNPAYVISRGSPGRVCVVDTSNNEVVDSVDVGDEPRSAVVSCDGRFLYVANDETSPNVTKIRTSDNVAIGDIHFTDAGTRNMSITPDGAKIYAGFRVDNIGILRTATDTTSTQALTDASEIYATAVIADGSRVYAVDKGNDEAYVLSVGTDTEITGMGLPISVGSEPRGIATAFSFSSCAASTSAPAPTMSLSLLVTLLLALGALGLWTLRDRQPAL